MTDALMLTGADVASDQEGSPVLRLLWRADGPEPDNWRGYRMEIAADDWLMDSSLDAFRPTEWVQDGSFVTTHPLEAGASLSGLRFRLLRAADGTPVTSPAAPEGWHALP
jgi:hypothetical protein